jgi:hypothetical protein
MAAQVASGLRLNRQNSAAFEAEEEVPGGTHFRPMASCFKAKILYFGG